MHVFLFSLFKSVRLFLISVACITLVACGGGGGSNDSPTPTPTPVAVITPEPTTPTPTPVAVVTPEPTPTPTPVPSDTSPDAFTLSVEGDAELHEEFTANVTISGIDTETAITINGTGGEYKIDDGDYTIATGTVVNGQTVTVKATASDAYATLREITLTIGDQSDVFSVTTRDAIITPADFEFIAKTNAEPGSTDNESNSITVTDIEIPVAISITGGEYKIDDSDYTAAEGAVSADQVVTVRVTAADDFATDTTASLTIGDKTADYVVTTKVADEMPNAFILSFPDLSEDIKADLDTEYTSSEITISGVEVDVPVSITNGLYQLNGQGDFVGTAGVARDGDTIIVKAVSSSSVNTSIAVSLSVGSESSPVNSVFNITTLDDINDPEVTILFPPALSLTDGPEVYIRGTATDDLSGIQSLMINGVPAEDTSEDGSFSTWQATIPLAADQENTLTVEAEDNASNMNFSSVSVTQDSVGINFPNDDNPFPDTRYGRMVWDESRNTLWISHVVNGDVYGVDITTGNRVPLNVTPVEDLTDARGDSILLAPDGDHLWVGNTNTGDIYEIDLVDSEDSVAGTRRVKWYGSDDESEVEIPGAAGLTLALSEGGDQELFITDNNTIVVLDVETNMRRIFSSDTIPNSVNTFGSLGGPLVRDEEYDCWLVSDFGEDTVFCVYDDGTREIFSNNSIPNPTSTPMQGVLNITLDIERDIALLSDVTTDEFYSVQLSGSLRGERSTLSSNTLPNTFNSIDRIDSLLKLDGFDYFFAMDRNNQRLLAVDLETGNRVVVSRGVPVDL